MDNKNPLSPHIQIYSWHISSLVSISHRITGIINILVITLICLWVASLLLGETNYEIIKFFLQSFFGKFLVIGIGINIVSSPNIRDYPTTNLNEVTNRRVSKTKLLNKIIKAFDIKIK